MGRAVLVEGAIGGGLPGVAETRKHAAGLGCGVRDVAVSLVDELDGLLLFVGGNFSVVGVEDVVEFVSHV